MSNKVSVLSLQNIRRAVDYGIILIIVVMAVQVTCAMAEMVAKGDAYGFKNGHYVHIDFIDIYSIGHLLQSDQRRNLYDPATQLDFYNQAIVPAKVDQCFYVENPPHYLLFVAPLSFLSLKHAIVVWNSFSICLATAFLILLRKANEKLKWCGMLAIVAATMASLPSADALMNGQAAWFFLAIFALFSYGFILNRQIVAGLALAVITFKPHYFVLLMIPSLIGKKFKLIAVAAITVIVLLAATATVVGWENVLFYPKVLIQAEGKNNFVGLFPEKMICLRGILSLFLARDLALHISLAAYLTGLVTTAWLWYLSLHKRMFPSQWAVALMIMIMLVTSPHLHLYDCILVALPAALTLPTVRFTEAMAIQKKSLKLWTLTLMLYPLLTWVFMLLAPKIGSAILPPAIQSTLTANGQSCGLLSFHCYLAMNIFLIAVGLTCALSYEKQKEAVT